MSAEAELRLAEAPRTNKLKLAKPSLKLDTEKVSGIYLIIHRQENQKKEKKEIVEKNIS